eukprot:5441042-Prymnesium_polylepis.1
MRPQSASHSSIEWVVRTVQQLAVRRLMTVHRKRLDAASMPLEGSSSSTSCGLPTSAMPTQSLRLLPPEYWPHGLSANLAKSRSLISPSTSASMRRLGTCLMFAYMRSVSRPVIRCSSASCCGQ